MAQKKEATASTDKKPKAKVQDLAPRKDAKGGLRAFSRDKQASGATTQINPGLN